MPAPYPKTGPGLSPITDDIVTIEPPPDLSIRWPTNLQVTNVPLMWFSSTLLKFSSGISSIGSRVGIMPAEVTQPLKTGMFKESASSAACIDDSDSTSPDAHQARGPSFLHKLTAASLSISMIPTAAPSSEAAVQIAAPIPLAPPVTTMDFCRRSIITIHSFGKNLLFRETSLHHIRLATAIFLQLIN